MSTQEPSDAGAWSGVRQPPRLNLACADVAADTESRASGRPDTPEFD